MEAFEAWLRARFPGEAEKFDDPIYLGTEWREKHLRFLREVLREAWDAGAGLHNSTREIAASVGISQRRVRQILNGK